MRLLTPLFFALSLALCVPSFAAAQVDINHADAKTLAESLEGIGLAKAEAIVAYREKHGPFERVEDLARVGGIGAHTIEVNRDAIVIVIGPPVAREPSGAIAPL